MSVSEFKSETQTGELYNALSTIRPNIIIYQIKNIFAHLH